VVRFAQFRREVAGVRVCPRLDELAERGGGAELGEHGFVEQVLREGSAELDNRQAELNIRAEQLEAREAAVARAEERVAARAGELGAVELRRAAVERREETVRARAIELERQAKELTALAARLEGLGAGVRETTEAPPERSHVVLTAGYRLLEMDGPAPAPGDVVELEDGSYRCLRVTGSPLPGDRRRCALLERSHQPDAGVRPKSDTSCRTPA
jgi:hypothetical protein